MLIASPARSDFIQAPSQRGRDRAWWIFVLAIVALKLVLLAADPVPKFYLGDSRSYWWTALTGWIPEDRSYFYGYVIRWVALSLSSFTPLLVLQTLAGSLVAIVLAWICLEIFQLPRWFAFLFGVLCAVDPLQ